MHPKRTLPIIAIACLTLAASAWPAPAAAQHRQAAHVATAHPVVVARAHSYHSYPRLGVRVAYGYPYFGLYPWYGYGYQWGIYPPYWYGPWGGHDGYYGYGSAVGSVRVQVKPKKAEVYVDGYYAGIVDDFDGMFQRLRLLAGEHEIVVYLEGYTSIRQKVYLPPGGTLDIKDTMQPLAAGEAQEPRPRPAAPPAQATRPGPRPAPPAGQAPEPMPPPAQPPAPMPPAGGGQVEVAPGYGTLSLRVQPADAEVLIDGEAWQGPEDQGPLTVQVAAGRHQVEVRKDGYQTFSTSVEVRDGEVTPLNVSIRRQ